MSILPETLVCPQCKQALNKKMQTFICQVCQLSYPINDGIPVLLIEQANKMGEK
jgi:uncharacterized protein YbaR (Trm112 family)